MKDYFVSFWVYGDKVIVANGEIATDDGFNSIKGIREVEEHFKKAYIQMGEKVQQVSIISWQEFK